MKAFEKSYLEIQDQVGHYFRNLYNLVKFVESSELKQREKRFYTNIIRAQLSHELTLLFYNCVSKYGRERFKPLIERYGLLKNMDTALLVTSEIHPNQFYEKSAFEGSPTSYSDGSYPRSG